MIRKDSLRLLMVVCVCSVFFCFGNGSAIAAEETEFTVGGLLSLTGNVQTLGKSSKAAMEIAISDANAAAAAGGLALRFKPMIPEANGKNTSAAHRKPGRASPDTG